MEQIHKDSRTVIFDNTLASENIDLNLLGHPKISLQAVWVDLTTSGDINAELYLQQSSDGESWDDMKGFIEGAFEALAISITTTDGSTTLQDDVNFGGNYLRVVIDSGDITGGNLKLILNCY